MYVIVHQKIKRSLSCDMLELPLSLDTKNTRVTLTINQETSYKGLLETIKCIQILRNRI